MINSLIPLLAGILPLYVVRFPLFGIPTNLFEVGVWITVVVCICTSHIRERLWVAVRAMPKRMLIFILLFLIAAAISTIVSPVTRSSLGILKSWIVTPILFGVLVSIIAAKKAIIRSLILSGLVIALFGFSQIHGFNRIYSVYDVPNSLALFLVPVSVLATYIGIATKNKLYQYSAAIMIIAIILTQSSGAILALVGTMIVAWRVFSPSYEGESPLKAGVGVSAREPTPPRLPLYKGRKYVAFVFSTLLLVTIAFFALSGRLSYLIAPLINPNTTNSVTVRMQLWDIGAHLIRQHPILGIALGQFEPAYQVELHRLFAEESRGVKAKTYKLQAEYVFRDPHNWIISFWLNTGLLGLLSFIGLNYLAIKRAFSPPARGGGSYRQAIALALISMLIFGLVDTIYWKNDVSALWWMLVFL